MPASFTHCRNVGSCWRGVQEATTANRADHIGQRQGILIYLAAINGPGNVQPAVAHKDTNANFIVCLFGSH